MSALFSFKSLQILLCQCDFLCLGQNQCLNLLVCSVNEHNLTIQEKSLLCTSFFGPCKSYLFFHFSFLFFFQFFIHVASYYIHHSIFLSYQSEIGHSPPPAYTPMSGVSISRSAFIFQDFWSSLNHVSSLVSL